MDRVRTASMAAGIATALALVQTWRLHRASMKSPGSPPDKPPPQPPDDGHSIGDRHQGKRTGWLRYPWLLPLAPIILLILALYNVATQQSGTSHFDELHFNIAGIFSLGALAVSAFTAYGPKRRYSHMVVAYSFGEFLAILLLMLSSTVAFILLSSPPVYILNATIFLVLSLGIGLILLVSWIPKWPFGESLVVGMISLTLGAVCVPGLKTITQTPKPPPVNGAGILYLAGEAAGQRIILDVHTEPSLETHNNESFKITSEGQSRINWALLLVGDAALQKKSISVNGSGNAARGHCINLLVDKSKLVLNPARGQLCSGTLGPGSHVSIHGNPRGIFINQTVIRSAASLPLYGQVPISFLSPRMVALIKQHLDGPPAAHAQNFTVNVTGDTLQQSESVMQSHPPANTNRSDALEWTTADNIQATYITTDQDKADAASNVMFTFAILLGVAVTGILTSIQGIVHMIHDRNS